MNEYLQELTERYARVGLLVDTNLLVLLFVGLINSERIKTFSKTSGFEIEDFALLRNILAPFDRIITTPNIMTEASNLIGFLNDPEKEAVLSLVKQKVTAMDERYITTVSASGASGFERLGVTDVVIGIAASAIPVPVLTADFHLYQHLGDLGVDAVNFNHLRFP